MWHNNYESTLEDWIRLRAQSAELPGKEALQLIQNWWQQAPTNQHYLHFDDYKEWPGPWDLLADNSYCEVAKALGIIYTLLIINHSSIEQITLIQTENNTYVRIILLGEEYTLGNEVGIINSIVNETILYQINCDFFKKKL